MSLRGDAFLCVWNDHDPAQAPEYEAWHTFEHVPERVCVPGFHAGRRYAGYERDAGRYLTLYDIAGLEVLDTPAYRDLQEHPTPWSARMRPAFRNFERIPCRVLLKAGGGCAGAMGVLVFSAERGETQGVEALKARLLALHAAHRVTSIHLGHAAQIPAYAVFATAARVAPGRETFVVLLEALSRPAVGAALAELAAGLGDAFGGLQLERQESSGFLFQVGAEELAGSPLRRLPA